MCKLMMKKIAKLHDLMSPEYCSWLFRCAMTAAAGANYADCKCGGRILVFQHAEDSFICSEYPD
jgi:hypothetical protein